MISRTSTTNTVASRCRISSAPTPSTGPRICPVSDAGALLPRGPVPRHTLVVASGFWMGPERGTRVGDGLAEPSYEVLVLRYGPTFDFVTKVRPVSVFG